MCSECGGSGEVRCMDCEDRDEGETCATCGGTQWATCDNCGGEGQCTCGVCDGCGMSAYGPI